MPTTTVLHVSKADIDYTIRIVEPWDDMQAIAEFAVYKADHMHAAEYSLEELMLRMWYLDRMFQT